MTQFITFVAWMYEKCNEGMLEYTVNLTLVGKSD